MLIYYVNTQSLNHILTIHFKNMNLIKKLTIIVLCLISINTIAQDYKQYLMLSYKSKYFIADNQIDSAINIYNQMFLIYEKLFPYDNLTAAKTFAAKKDTTTTLRLITNMIKDGLSLDEILENKKNDSIFSFAKQSKMWEALKLVKPEIDYATLAAVEKWYEVDQFIRNKFDDTCVRKYMPEIDSINCLNLITLIKNQGFPGYKKLGFSSYIVTITIMHSTTNTSTEKYWESYFKPLLYSEAIKGNIGFDDYAVILDRYHFAKNKKQIYGTYNSFDGFGPIENIKEVDIRRAEIGLPKLSIVAKLKGIKLPKDYQP